MTDECRTKPPNPRARVALGREIIIQVVACPYCGKVHNFCPGCKMALGPAGKLVDGQRIVCLCCGKRFMTMWQ